MKSRRLIAGPEVLRTVYRTNCRIFDACGAVDEVKHEIKYYFGSGASQHLRQCAKRDAPTLWIDQKKCKSIFRYFFKDFRQNRKKVSRICFDLYIRISHADLFQLPVSLWIAFDEER